MGGWKDSATDKYSRLVNDPSARSKFISHVVTFIKDHGFDGLDLDWEYPRCWQVSTSIIFIRSNRYFEKASLRKKKPFE